MDKKYGVYICEGCGIGDALDIEKLGDVAKEEGYAVKTCPILCGKAGVELLKKDIADEGVNTLVIAACSRRVLYDVFRFDGCIVDRVNLREGVVWTHPRSKYPAPTEEQKDDENFVDHVQLLAEDYLKMGMALFQITDESVYLSTQPLYHSAPAAFALSCLQVGATVVLMEKFDAETSLALIEKYRATHSQWVPTMFVRILKLPEEKRLKYDLSSMKVVIHAAAPCPPVSGRMIKNSSPP